MANDEKLSLQEAQKQGEKFKIAASNDTVDESNASGHFKSTDAPQPFYESFGLMVKDFNRFFIKTLLSNQPYVIWEHDNSLNYFTYENFHKEFSYVKVANSLFGEKNKVESNVKPTKYWLDSYHKRTARGIKFWPSITKVDPKDPKCEYFNTWRDWPIKPVEDEAKCRVAREYLFEVICFKKKSKYRHLLDFLAHMFQKPEEKPTFGLAIKGEEEGTGKSELSNQLMLMVGLDNSTTTSNPDQIFGTHNGIMSNCIFLSLAEVDWTLYKRYANKLRDLFTIRFLTIDEKFMPPTKQDSFTRIIIDGNAEHIMHVSRTARRLTIFNVNPVHRGDTKYFGQFKDVMDNGGREALMYYLMNRNISKFDPYKPLYTEELDEQKELSLNQVPDFWLNEVLEDAKLPYDETVNVVDDLGKVIDVFYKVIVEKLVWCFNEVQRRSGQRQLSSKAFGRQFRRIVPEMPPAHDVKCSTEWVGKQLNCFLIKGPKECRDYFVEHEGWQHKTWSDYKEFEKLDVDRHLWYKGW